MRVESFLEPVNYQDSGGDWVPVDNTLVSSPGPVYEAENAESGYVAKIPADAGSTPVKVASDGFWVTMKLRGLDGAPRIEDDTATFDQLPNAGSVEFQATGGSLKESINLEQAPTAPVAYTYDIATSSNVAPRLVPAVGVEFVDDSGTVQATMPIGLMWDSAESPATLSTGDYELTQSQDGWVVTLSPDLDWLQDPARDYPVVVDPSITLTPLRDCVLEEKRSAPNASFCGAGNQLISTGRADNTSTYWFRGLVDFTLPAIRPLLWSPTRIWT